MSIKGRTFENMLGNPLNIHNFMVTIPALDNIQMMVSSTTFPSEQLQDYVMYFQGERVKFPSIPTNSGVWNCTMPEGELAKVYQSLRAHMRLNYNQTTGKMTHWAIRDKFDIIVTARGLRGDVNGSDRIFSTTLVGCYVKGRQDVNLDNSQATTNWVWSVQFSFDAIHDETATPLTPPEPDTTP
jgi:hypothetical protein